MEPVNQNPTPNTSPINPVPPVSSMPPVSPAHGEKSIGPAIGIIIIIGVIILGGLYFWGQRAEKQELDQAQQSANNTAQTATGDQNIEDLKKQSSSDDVNSIEADLNATNLDQIGSEMNSIEAAASASSSQ